VGAHLQPDISVVIPVYNGEKYVAEAITSVQQQTGVNLEIICVNDGSTDNTGQLLKQLASGDNRIKVIRQQNKGLAGARNTGIANATGEFIIFLDCDDKWLGDQLRTLVAEAKSAQLDILLFDAESFRDEGVSDDTWDRYATYYQRSSSYEKVTTGMDLAVSMQKRSEYRPSACLQIIRREFLLQNNLLFHEGFLFEDNAFTFAELLAAKRAKHLNLPFYGRRLRPDSIVTSSSLEPTIEGYFAALVDMVGALGRSGAPAEFVPELDNIIWGIWRRVANDLQGQPASFIDALPARVPSPIAPQLLRAVRQTSQLLTQQAGAQPPQASTWLSNAELDQPLQTTDTVSVIIPMYNAEFTISETIESIQAQTYANLEIIVVDDNSTDGCSEIADEFAANDPRVKVIHKATNEYANRAREDGFLASTGSFITFVDADDVLPPDAIATLLHLQELTHADICMGGLMHCDRNLIPWKEQMRAYPPGVAVYRHDDMLERFLVAGETWPHNNNPLTAHCKLFRRKLLEGLDWRAADYRIGEDKYFSLLTFARAKKSAVTNKIVYYYRFLETSKSRESNRVFTYQGRPITALTQIEDFAKLAEKELPKGYTSAIARRIYHLSKFFENADGMEVPRYLLTHNDEVEARRSELEQQLNEREVQIAALQAEVEYLRQENQTLSTMVTDTLNSRTYKTGQLVSTPLRVARRFTGAE